MTSVVIAVVIAVVFVVVVIAVVFVVVVIFCAWCTGVSTLCLFLVRLFITSVFLFETNFFSHCNFHMFASNFPVV